MVMRGHVVMWDVLQDSDDEANTTTTAKVSMADYFKQKMAGRHLIWL